MSIPVMHPQDKIFFFTLEFIPCKNIHYSTRLNASMFVLFTFKQKENFRTCPGISNVRRYLIADWMNSYEQRPLIGLNLFIDHALPANKTKTNKMDHDLCVFEWSLIHNNIFSWEWYGLRARNILFKVE